MDWDIYSKIYNNNFLEIKTKQVYRFKIFI